MPWKTWRGREPEGIDGDSITDSISSSLWQVIRAEGPQGLSLLFIRRRFVYTV